MMMAVLKTAVCVLFIAVFVVGCGSQTVDMQEGLTEEERTREQEQMRESFERQRQMFEQQQQQFQPPPGMTIPQEQ